ncbi:SulP family inorganic anion transporter [Hydrogenimonas sp.]
MFAQLLKAYSGHSAKNDVLSGIVVAIALVPEAIAFSLIAGVSPLVGLYTAFILGLITALFGGKPGMISGATGSVAVVMVALVATHGVEYLFFATLLTGFIQLLFGLFKLAKFIRLVPQPAILGFVNGLAIVIALAQLPMFEGEGAVMYILVFATMATMVVLPKITKAVPAGLVAIVVLSVITVIFDLDTKRVADLGSIAGDLPSFHWPDVPLSLETLWIVLPYAAVMAAVGLIESLLTLSVLDEMSGEKGNANKEAMALGAGNATCGVFGGMAGCAMIGQSIINYTSGGRGRLSGVTAAVLLILFVVALSDYIGQIPIAVLVGIMFMVSVETFEWASIDRLRKMPRTDAFILVTVTVVTIFTDLAMAVVIGVIISALVFAWQHARVYTRSFQEGRRKIYEFDGPLFFGSVQGFLDQFDVANDPEEVVMDFKRTRVMDSSGVEAIDKITRRYEEAGKKLTIRHLSDDCKRLLKAAGRYCTYEEDDPTYKVAVNHEEYRKVY